MIRSSVILLLPLFTRVGDIWSAVGSVNVETIASHMFDTTQPKIKWFVSIEAINDTPIIIQQTKLQLTPELESKQISININVREYRSSNQKSKTFL
jgi:hypothetical protein